MKAVRRRCRGFSAIELVVTLAVAGIFAAVAFPNFASLIQNSRLSTAGDLLTVDLQIARREAIKRNGKVLVCPVGTGGACATDFTTWANGWILCYDLDGTAGCDTGVTGNPNPILQRGKLNPSLTLTVPASAVTFYANGTASGPVANATTTFTFRGTWTASTSYVSSVAASGAISLAKGS